MERLLWVLGLVALCVLAGYGMYRRLASSRGSGSPGLAPLPVAPADLGADLVDPVTGLYISTTTAGQLAGPDRRAADSAGGPPARSGCPATGVSIERDGESDIFIPIADIEAVGHRPRVSPAR